MHAVKTQLLYALVLKSLSFFEANEHCNFLVDTYVSLLLLYGHANVFSQYTHNVLSMYSVLKGFFALATAPYYANANQMPTQFI